jgi:hypothetical protein
VPTAMSTEFSSDELLIGLGFAPGDCNFSITLGNRLEQLVESSHAAPIA